MTVEDEQADLGESLNEVN